MESKSFEIAKNAIELSLIECSRDHVSFVTMGFAAALWLRDVLLEVVKMSNDQNLFRSFCEGNKIFVLQKQRNGKGRFVTNTALGDSKSKGYVIIPEGRDVGGWQGASQEITNIMDAQNHGTHEFNQRRPQPQQPTVQGNCDSNLGKESRTFKEAVTQGDTPNISLKIAGNQGAASQLSNVMAKDKLELSIKILLSRGPSGEWDVQWAGVENMGPSHSQVHVPPLTNETNGPLLSKVTPNENPFNSKAKTQSNNPKHKMVWQPQVNGSQKIKSSVETGTTSTTAHPNVDRVSLHSCDFESELSKTPGLIPTPPMTTQNIEDAFQELSEVDRSWGSSRDWFLDLRDRRRLWIPVDLRSLVAEMRRPEDAVTQKLVQWVSSQRETIESDVEDEAGVSEGETLGLESGYDNVGVLSGCEADGSFEDIGNERSMVLKEEKETSGLILTDTMDEDWNDLLMTNEVDDGVRDEGEKDLVPLNVEPLAVAFLDGVENHGGQAAGSYGSQSSDWVQRRQKAIGKMLGANYEGYEQAVTVLVMDIEARHLQRKASMSGLQKPMSLGRKGAR